VTEFEVVLPPGYPELLEDLKNVVAAACWRAQRVVNTDLLALYWRIGHTILDRQDAEGWGARVIDRLSADLRAAYPEMRGLSRCNFFYMRSFAASWPQEPIVQQAVGRQPWDHVTGAARQAPRPTQTGLVRRRRGRARARKSNSSVDDVLDQVSSHVVLQTACPGR